MLRFVSVVLCLVSVVFCVPVPQQPAQTGQIPPAQHTNQLGQEGHRQSIQPSNQNEQSHPTQPIQVGRPQSIQEPNQRQNEQKQAVEHFTSSLVENPHIRERYLNCFLENGPCSPDARNVKEMIPEALENECKLCNDIQKKIIEKMMCFLNNHQPEILQKVTAKFDPQGEYMKQYINALEKKQNEEVQKQLQSAGETTLLLQTTTKKP
ncbi:allergen Tha p 1-like isoform X2 [Daktulosphaira vitifoliae]|uniref:Chemosensory protein 9 n=1 Tax=Daktulosphaira vitifoliae TaxID=58002 RepID=A0A1W6R6G2_DAKVI|nr:allergen Tha p 1-like isoform X2 [Daktulosphaira vitifoliae]ARO50013.1 chemosensory protein 9 [Daktulosphaira vitifoliae]